VSGTSAVQVEFTLGGITQRLIIVHPAGGEPVSFVLEAPSDDFDSAVDEMASVPGLR
jgi:hypothetical protein